MAKAGNEGKVKLTVRQQRFVEEYLIDLNGKQAAIRAGYSKKTAEQGAAQLLSNIKVAAAIDKAKAERSEKTQITQEYVLEGIRETLERCRQVEPVIDRNGVPVMCETAEGDVVPAYTFNAAGVYKGAELLGKHLGMFVEKQEIEHSGDVVFRTVYESKPKK